MKQENKMPTKMKLKETKEQIYERLCNERQVPHEVRLEGQFQREMIERLMEAEYKRGLKNETRKKQSSRNR